VEVDRSLPLNFTLQPLYTLLILNSYHDRCPGSTGWNECRRTFTGGTIIRISGGSVQTITPSFLSLSISFQGVPTRRKEDGGVEGCQHQPWYVSCWVRTPVIQLSAGSISTANGSSLVRMGETTMVCGIKAEVAEPNIATPEEGYVGELTFSPCSTQKPTSSAQRGSTRYMLAKVQAGSTLG
jgi:hypothetical protein